MGTIIEFPARARAKSVAATAAEAPAQVEPVTAMALVDQARDIANRVLMSAEAAASPLARPASRAYAPRTLLAAAAQMERAAALLRRASKLPLGDQAREC